MSIWGFCPQCMRWFACPTWFDRAEPQPLCPVCLSEPRALRNDTVPPEGAYEAPAAASPCRGSDASPGDDADPQVWGRCPGCMGWFPAHTWFEDRSPLPVCLRCRLLPNALRGDPPASAERVRSSEAG